MNLFLELRRHGKLAEKRHPMYEKSKFGKFWMYFMSVFWAGYLIFFGTTFAFRLRRRRQRSLSRNEQRPDLHTRPGLPFAVTLPENTDTGS